MPYLAPRALVSSRFTYPAAASFAIPMANLFRFLQEVRAEADKVTWPSRRETLITTGLVIILVVFTSLFFLAVDQSLRLMVSLILKLGH
ncbi:Protein translocase subunit SecE [Methylovirgula sp. HY1]|nr:Protein translocase subunit SecE [Methylovirgula sp. HY1]